MYRECELQPRIEVTANTFKIILPNMNAGKKHIENQQPKKTKLAVQKQVILDCIAKHGQITDDQIQQELNLKKTRAYTLVRQMREEGLIVVSGRGTGKNICCHRILLRKTFAKYCLLNSYQISMKYYYKNVMICAIIKQDVHRHL